jgi:Spy/CpxP family protein refolding chaperone
MRQALLLAGPITAGLAIAAAAEIRPHHAASPAAGPEGSEISSLSAKDVEDLAAGRGWGFAKPAELNGYPGPLHVLELAETLSLAPEQRAQVQAIFDRMAAAARETGRMFITAERALDQAFRSRAVNETTLLERVEAAETLRAALRRIHLAAHLETTPVLTPEQRQAYAALRGHDTHQMPQQGDRHHRQH